MRFNKYSLERIKTEDLNKLFSKVIPADERRRSKDRKLLVKYDKMYK